MWHFLIWGGEGLFYLYFIWQHCCTDSSLLSESQRRSCDAIIQLLNFNSHFALLYCIQYLSKQNTCPQDRPYFRTLISQGRQKWNFSMESMAAALFKGHNNTWQISSKLWHPQGQNTVYLFCMYNSQFERIPYQGKLACWNVTRVELCPIYSN